MKEIKGHITRWRDIPYSWIRRISIVKMTILPKAIYRFNTILIKLSITFITELQQRYLQFVQKHRRPQIAKVIFRKKNRALVIRLPVFRLYCKAIVSRQYGTSTKKDIRINGKKVEKAQRQTHVSLGTVSLGTLSLTREARIYNGEKTASSMNGVGKS